jgi:sodium-dependent dicarboxylate transporter 2/3/5
MDHRSDRSLAVSARAALARGHDTLGQGWRRFRATPYGSWLAYLRAKKWLFVALLVGLWMLNLPLPEGLSQAGLIVLTMSVVATILFVTEPIPLPAVALLIVVGQVLLLGLDSSEVARSLMSDSVLFIMGSLMIAVAVVKQKLDKRLAFLIVRFTGTKTVNVCLGIALVSGLLASFIGEHTVAAMMLPVGVTLISLTADDPARVRRLAIVVLLSISYGASIAGIGTPSGGARNAIMIGYWREFFFDPSSSETSRYAVDYLKWMAFAYPVFLIQIPFVTMILFMTFRPEQRTIARAVVRLRAQLADQGAMKAADWMTIGIFCLILFGWILLSDAIGLGTVAVLGAAAFLVLGLVRWEELNTHRGGHQHHVERRSGCGVGPDHPEPGSRGRRGPAGDWLHHGALLGLRLPHRGRHAGLHDRLCVRLSAHDGLPQGRLENACGIDHHNPDGRLVVLAAIAVSHGGPGPHGHAGR